MIVPENRQINEARYQRLSAAGREIWDALALGMITVRQALDELNEQDQHLLEQWAREDLQRLREHQEKLDAWWRKHQTNSCGAGGENSPWTIPSRTDNNYPKEARQQF